LTRSACGLDFGTSNTTLGRKGPGGRAALLPLEGTNVTIPSAIFFHRSGRAEIGRAAIAAYVDGESGRLMRSLKSVLGSTLLNESTPVGRQRITFREVIARYIGEVKSRAEAEAGVSLTQVVHGRPVHFVDGDPQGDRDAEAALAEIARSIGFAEVSFQYEPIAAALDYEQQIGAEQIALIADIGGGTSDFSIVRLSPERHRRPDRQADILANDGVRIGGTDFDRQLSLGTIMPLFGYRSAMKRGDLDVPSSYFHDLATWSSINRLYDRRVHRELEEVRRDASAPQLIDRLVTVVEAERGHTLAMEVEGAKIGLSDRDSVELPLAWSRPASTRPPSRPMPSMPCSSPAARPSSPMCAPPSPPACPAPASSRATPSAPSAPASRSRPRTATGSAPLPCHSGAGRGSRVCAAAPRAAARPG
jgi:hypothetical chaperone protein